MTTDDPKRWSDPDGGAPEGLRSLLDAGRSEAPSAAALARLTAKLGAAGSGSPPGGAPAAGPAKAVMGSAVAKVTGALLLSGAVALGLAVAFSSTDRPVQAPTTHASRPATAPIAPRPSSPGPLDPPPSQGPAGGATPSGEPHPVGGGAAPPGARRREKAAHEVGPAGQDRGPASGLDEVTLLERAQDALRTDPGRALGLVAEHERLFGQGALGQEREVIAIEALLRTGQRDRASARAERFRARHSTSGHLRRIDALLGAAADPAQKRDASPPLTPHTR